MENHQTINNQDMFLHTPRAQQFDEFSRISKEMHEGLENASHSVFFMSRPGARLPMFESINDQDPNSQGGSQTATLNLNENTTTANTTISMPNQNSTLAVQTQISAPENITPNNSSRDPRRSSSSKRVRDEAEKAAEQSLVTCQRCGVNFKTDVANNSNHLKTTEEFLFRDSHCGKCREDINAAGTWPSNKENNAETSNKRHLKEEADNQTSSSCCCIIM